MDLSLDELIKINKLGRKSLPGKQNIRGLVSDRTLSHRNSNLPLRNNSKSRLDIKDARLKIIQNKRKNSRDARNKLSAVAKTTQSRKKLSPMSRNDARFKLLKLKESNWKRPSTTPGRVTSMKNNTLRASIPNPARQNGKNLPNTNNFRQGKGREFDRRLMNIQDSFSLKRSIRNNISKNRGPDHRGQNELLLRTVNNEQRMSEMDFAMKMQRPSSIKVVMQNNSAPVTQNKNERQQHEMDMELDEAGYFKQSLVSGRIRTYNSDEHMNNRGRMSQEMMARLDSVSPASRSLGVFSSPAAQPMSMNADIGHRIVVSNLQSSVTHEDIKELFEDIGPLLASRVVRPGTAEVIYNLQKDAKKAVEAYHNRQLDGQPMKCMLVNPRPYLTSPPSAGVLGTPGQQKIPSSSKSSVVPDLNAIHKALFSK